MKLSMGEIGTLITALDAAIAYSEVIISSNTIRNEKVNKTDSLAANDVTEARENLRYFRPLRKKLLKYEKEQVNESLS